MPTTHFRTCNLCEAMCGIEITVEGERVSAIRGDQADPFSQGYICPKATALGDIHHDPDRLKRPLRRTATGWTEIGWDEALDEVGRRLASIRRQHGPHAVAIYNGNPTVHNHTALLYGLMFIKTLRSRSRFSATSADQLPKMLAALTMFGHQLLMPIPDVDRTDYFLMFGANPLVSNGSIMSAPGMRRRLADIRGRGGKVVVFDPRHTETAKAASEHVFVRPGTDALLLFAMVQVICQEGLVRFGHLQEYVKRFDLLRDAAAVFTPESVQAATGVDPETVRRIAREFATAERAVAYGRVGVSTQEFGGIANWLIEVLNAITGHLDREGGAMFTEPAIDLVQLGSLLGEQGHYDKFRSRVRGIPEFGGELPVSCLAEEIETPGDKQIRALVTHAGNPVLSIPNGRRLESALAQLDFMVAIDIYLNETTRHAHIILPPTAALEHDHYDLAFHALAVRNTTKYAPALFPRQPEQRHDWEIFVELASRLTDSGTAADPILRRAKSLLGRGLSPRRVIDLLLRLGPHGLKKGLSGLSLAKVEAEVHGIDLGPLTPQLPGRLQTRDRKIDLAPEKLVADVERLRKRLGQLGVVEPGALLLIGRRELRSNNSWCHNSPRLVKGPERCTLLIHPADAAERGIAAGAQVRIASRVGELAVPAELSEDVMRGVVSLPHGYGHNRPGTRLSVAAQHAGVSINDLTDEQWIDAMAGTASFNGVPVRVEAVAPPPPI